MPESNQRPPPYHGVALPTELKEHDRLIIPTFLVNGNKNLSKSNNIRIAI